VYVKEMFVEILRYLTIAAVVVFLAYLRWKSLKSRVRDLGDGGVQTLFGSKKSR
jgi:hypothetical protein